MDLIRRDRLIEQLQASRRHHFLDADGNKDIALGLTMAIHSILEQPIEIEVKEGYEIVEVKCRKVEKNC